MLLLGVKNVLAHDFLKVVQILRVSCPLQSAGYYPPTPSHHPLKKEEIGVLETTDTLI